MLGDDWFVRWCQFVCVVCVVLFLIELGINKFCGLGGERFLWCDMRVIRCWRECGSLFNLGLRVSEVFWCVL